MKKLFSFLLAAAMVLVVSVPAFAQEIPSSRTSQPLKSTVVVENLGNGITVETKTTLWNTSATAALASSSRSASRTKTYKANGSTVATVTLNATFGYDGSSAWVSSKSASHSTVSGWSYGSQSLSSSGGTASLSAVLTQKLGIITIGTVDVDISLTCSPSGQIS